MGHYLSEVDSNRVRTKTCSRCGEVQRLVGDFARGHREDGCIRFLRARIEKLEKNTLKLPKPRKGAYEPRKQGE